MTLRLRIRIWWKFLAKTHTIVIRLHLSEFQLFFHMNCSTGWLKTIASMCPQMPSNSFGNDGQSSSLSIQLLNWLYTTLLESAGTMLNTPLGAQKLSSFVSTWCCLTGQREAKPMISTRKAAHKQLCFDIPLMNQEYDHALG